MDIKTYVLKRKQNLKERILKDGGTPSLIIIQVNDDFASNKYVAGKINDAREVGISAKLIKMPETTRLDELLKKIKKLNKDPHVNGIIVQLPLPKHIDENIVKEAINPAKDVDGFHPVNVGKMVIGKADYLPCTPAGIQQLLVRSGVKTDGAEVVGHHALDGQLAADLPGHESSIGQVRAGTGKKDEVACPHRGDIVRLWRARGGEFDPKFVQTLGNGHVGLPSGRGGC